MRKSLLVILIVVLVALYASLFVVQEGSVASCCVSVRCCAMMKTSRWCMPWPASQDTLYRIG